MLNSVANSSSILCSDLTAKTHLTPSLRNSIPTAYLTRVYFGMTGVDEDKLDTRQVFAFEFSSQDRRS